MAKEEATQLRLDRQRRIMGWRRGSVQVYGVKLVTEPTELAEAQRQLEAREPSEYIVLRVSATAVGNFSRAHNLRQLIESEGYVARPPTDVEYEALERGIAQVGGQNAPAARPSRRFPWPH